MASRKANASLAKERASGAAALLIVDMISAWDFPDAKDLLTRRLCAAHRCSQITCKKNGVPVIYANDNHGRWRSDFRQGVDSRSPMAVRAHGSLRNWRRCRRLFRAEAQAFGLLLDATWPAARAPAGAQALRHRRDGRPVRAGNGHRRAHAGLRSGGTERLHCVENKGAQQARCRVLRERASDPDHIVTTCSAWRPALTSARSPTTPPSRSLQDCGACPRRCRARRQCDRRATAAARRAGSATTRRSAQACG